jgi:rod shape-determining protein MreC
MLNKYNKKKKNRFKTSNYSKNIVIFITVLPLILIIISPYNNINTKVSLAFNDFISKIYILSDHHIEKIRGFFAEISSFNNYKQERNILIEENQKLRFDNSYISALKKENRDLKALIHYTESINFQYISSRIISLNLHSSSLEMMLNAGFKSGIKLGQAVVNSDGLVGRIVRVSDDASKLITWNNPNFKVPVILTKSNIHCIAIGSETGMRLMYIPENLELIPGEEVLTSGDGGLLPFGIKVGTITHNKLNLDNIEDQVIVIPSANLNSLELVLVAISN